MSRRAYACCPQHPNAVLVADHTGNTICPECGTVVGDRVVDVGSEWRTFNDQPENPWFGGPSMPAPDNQFNQFMFANPVVSAAGQQVLSHYSEKLVSQSSGLIDRNLRPFFAVDDSYAMKKLSILLFPFAHRQWYYSPGEQHSLPKFNVNAPDLYIPLMAFFTYVLVAGCMLGLKDKFTPEQLGYLSSSALVCLSVEVCLLMIIFHFCSVRCWFNVLHYIALCGYKFVPIILSMLISLLFKTTGYYITIFYSTLALGYFMIRSFHVALEASQVHDHIQPASRLGDYIIGGFSLAQPFFMMWLSYHLVA